MHKKAMIAILAVFVGLILMTMSVPLSQAIVPPRGDYSDTVGVEYDYGTMGLAFDVPAKEKFHFAFGLPGGQCMLVDGNDPAVRFVADALDHDGASPRSTLSEITRWIHTCIDYADDTGWPSDHWQLPSETLRKGTGDCEDMAILGASMAEALGHRTALVFLETHVMFAMECEPWAVDATIEHEGRTYVIADPTSNRVGWPAEGASVTDTIWTPFNIAFVGVQAFGVILSVVTIIYAWRKME